MEWQAPEYEHFEKDFNWFRNVFLVTIGAVILALLFKNFIFAAILLAGGFTIILYGARLPEMLEVKLTERGIRLNNLLYPYDKLRSFWLTAEHGEERGPKLLVEGEHFFLPHLVIPLADDIKPSAVRAYLAAHLPETRREESLADLIFDLLHF